MTRPSRQRHALLLLLTGVAVGCSAGAIGDPKLGATGTRGGPAGSDGSTTAGRGSSGHAGSGAAGDAEHACDALDVGTTPLQRLTRTEYANSVRDLLGVTAPTVNGIAQDEHAGPFASNTVAPISDLSVDQYMRMAESLALATRDQLESLVACDRVKLGDQACATRFIEQLGRRVYRRPLGSEESSAYGALFASYAPDGYVDALRVITQTMLQSPNFLYRVELLPDSSAADAEVAPLDAHELATRLAFFLTSTTPDDALLSAADSGKLTSEAELRAQVGRLLASTHATDALGSFHLQWLELDRLAGLSKDPLTYPAFDAALADAMQQETVRFVDHVIRHGDAKLESLLSAPYSFLDGPLFELYGVQQPASHDPETPVDLDPAQRAGLLTQAGFLAVHGHENQSAPVQRGKVVIRNLLCEELPDPPPNVNTTPPAPSPNATTRERFAAHEQEPACAVCHVRIDGVGMGFENYDGIGAFRSMDGKQRVDATGKLDGTRDLDGAFEGAVALAQKLSKSQQVSDCVATQWLRFSLGRLEADADGCSLAGIQQAFDASGGDVRVLLESIALSDSFRKKRVLPQEMP